MTADSVACGATHCATRFSLADLVACGAIGVAAVLVIEALTSRESDVETCRGR